MKNKTKRPWQGTVLGIIYSLVIVGVIATIVQNLTVQLLTFVILQDVGLATKFLGGLPVTLITSFVVVIILTLITVGLFYGKLLAIRIATIVIVITFLLGVINLMKTFVLLDFKNSVAQLIGLIFLSFVGWLIITCLKHSFYGGSGIINLNTFKFWRKRNFGNEDMTTFK